MYFVRLLMITSLCLGFQPQVRVYKKSIIPKGVTVYENSNIVPEETNGVLFFTGGNGIIPSEIYDGFLKNLAEENLSVHVGPSDKDECRDVLYHLLDEYKDVTVMGHSSGCVNAVRAANFNKKCKKAILLDPVNNVDVVDAWPPKLPSFNPFWGDWQQTKKEKNLQFKNIDSLLTLKAVKSYKWNFFGDKKVPFLLVFGTDGKELAPKADFKIVKFADNGHTDVLDKVWSDFMHNSVSPGTEERDSQNLYEYRKQLAIESATFIRGEQEEQAAPRETEEKKSETLSSKNTENNSEMNLPYDYQGDLLD